MSQSSHLTMVVVSVDIVRQSEGTYRRDSKSTSLKTPTSWLFQVDPQTPRPETSWTRVSPWLPTQNICQVSDGAEHHEDDMSKMDWFHSLWPSDTIWPHQSGSTLAQVMACCRTASSHYLNQCCLIISKVRWHSYEGSFTKDTSAINH